jgi:hypothetical protein
MENTGLFNAEGKALSIADVSKRFSVHTYSIINEGSPMYVHWSEGLKMIIVKDGVTLKLNSEEIEQLVKALPRTVGGTY